MKITKYFLLSLLVGSSAFAQSRFYAEAGFSYAALRGANYATGLGVPSSALSSTVAGAPIPTTTTTLLAEDKSTWAPFVAAGYSFSDQIGLKLSYQYIGNLTASAKSTLLVGGDVVLGDVMFRFNDDVHVVSLAPEFKWPVVSRLTLTISPELNWVASRGEVLASTTSPAIDVFPRRSRHEQEFSLGASVGARWSFADSCDLIISYKYADLKPSWGRQAHLFSGGLHFRF